MDDLTLGDKIRVMKLGTWGDAWHFLDKAAALVDEHAATVAAAYEAAAQEAEAEGWESAAPIGFSEREEGSRDCAERIATAIRALTAADAAAALDRIKAEAVREALSDFTKADWFWRDLDPDDCGDTPDEAINAGMVGRFAVCHIRSSFTGPDRFCFIAPVLDPESDDEECLCFATEEEAIAAAKERHSILAAAEKETGNG